MSAKGWSPDLVAHKLTYDYSTHGGATGTIALGNLPDKFIPLDAVAYVETALVGGGTFVVGEDGGGDADGYWTDLDAASAGSSVSGSGALLIAAQRHIVDATKDGVQVTIATTAYTAGKIHFIFSGIQPV